MNCEVYISLSVIRKISLSVPCHAEHTQLLQPSPGAQEFHLVFVQYCVSARETSSFTSQTATASFRGHSLKFILKRRRQPNTIRLQTCIFWQKPNQIADSVGRSMLRTCSSHKLMHACCCTAASTCSSLFSSWVVAHQLVASCTSVPTIW